MAAHAAPGTVEALILQKTQAFSDAGLTGDKAAMDSMLAPDVAFTNEDGSTPTKAEILAGVSPPPAGLQKSIKVTDFKVRVHGPVAVATFTDVLDQSFRGQSLRFRYRSTEVWRRDPVGWRIIASQTLTLAGDPAVAHLAPTVLDDYVGTYDAGGGAKVRIERAADGIASSVNGGAAVEMKPELKDVFFIPGQPHLRRIFERDPQGRVIGYVNRIDGQDLRARRT
ncbi:MAG TPA: nuclear transport factor 2 family protein [Caulobacteraceae bacterium]